MKIQCIIYKYRGADKHDEYPLYLRMTARSKCRYISLDERVEEKYFDSTKGLVKQRHPSAERINRLIEDKTREVKNALIDLKLKNGDASLRQVKDAIVTDTKNFFQFAEDWIEKYNTPKSIRTYARYKAHLNKLEKFHGSKDLQWFEIDPTYLRKYSTYLELKRGNDVNTIHSTLKSVRAIIRAAVMEGACDFRYNPFNTYRLKSKRTMKIALTSDEMRAIVELKLPIDSEIYHVRSSFLLAYFFAGLRFGDIATLTWNHLTSDLRHINREMMKTGDVVSLEVPEPAYLLLQHYHKLAGGNPKPTEYVLPILSTDESVPLLRRVSSATAKANKWLKVIADENHAKINKPVTTHVSRHSYARAALAQDVNVKTIQMLLGHANLNTTAVYLGLVGTPELSKQNKLIIGNL